MNYQKLENEIKDYSNYFKYCDSITSKLSLFFKEFTKSGNKFILKTKKSLDDIYSEINKEEYFSSSLIKNLGNLCNEFKKMMNTLESLFTKIEKDIIDKITEFDKDYKTNNKNNLNKLSDLNTLLSDNRSKLEKIKNIYFDSCKTFTDFDKKFFSNKQKENIKEEELTKLKDQYEKLKQASEAKKISYRIEVTKLNDLLISNENNYVNIINMIAKQEENKTIFLIKILTSFINGLKEYNSKSKELIGKNEKYIDDIYYRRDIKLFSLYFNRINNNKEKSRFLFEEFLDYENFNKTPDYNISGENNKNKQKKEIIKNDIVKKDIHKIDFKLALKILELGEEPFIDTNEMDNEFMELYNIIFNLIYRDEKIDDDKYLRLINFVDGKVEGSKNFIYLLMGHYCSNNIVKFNNVENLYLLNSILNMIINYIWDNDDYTYLSFIILYIGEKTVYYNSNDKTPISYLCKIMSKNTIYHTDEFWIKIINLKIKMLARIKINEEIHIRKKNNVLRKDSLFKFFGNKDEGNEKIENEILYSQLYKEKSADYCTEILSEYIPHFIKYDFMEDKTYTIIKQLSEEYFLNARQKNYFLEMINSNIIYQQSPNPYFNEDQIGMIKCDTQEDLNKYYFSFDSNKKFKSIKKNEKVKIILFVMKYLNNKDIISLLCLNKEYNSKLKKFVYKNILIKYNNNINIKNHINIWRSILNYNLIKRKYNYKSILESISKEKNSIFDIIELDSKRTTFEKNLQSNQKKLCNILKVASKELPTVNYCQGMNHIAAFLLVLCEENDEETFYLFISILFATDYCSLINNDLFKLNSFFYCFNRLLNIMFPEMDSFFKNIKVDGGYFLSPWFITLFTNAYNCEKRQDNLKIMLRIFDLFILSGWKAIFKIAISLIKKNSIKLFSLSYDKLIHYLNNEIIHSDFFKNENLNEIMNISINFKLSNNLIKNLCKEYEMKINIINKNK